MTDAVPPPTGAGWWRRRPTWLLPLFTFVMGIFVAASAQFLADWATDARRTASDPQPTPSPGCEQAFRVVTAGETYLDAVARPQGDPCWSRTADLGAGDTFDVSLKYANRSDDTQQDVTVFVWLPDDLELVAGTTYLANSNSPDGKLVSDGITGNGLNIGGYLTGAAAYMKFTVRLAPGFERPCGTGTVTLSSTLIGIDSWKEKWASVTAITDREC